MTKNKPQDEGLGRYINRELSWLAFNERVLAEAENTANPLLERLKFLAIFESNLDEFYMVRVSGLIEQFDAGVLSTTVDGLSPNEQLEQISKKVAPLRSKASELFAKEIEPALHRNAIHLRSYAELAPQKQEEIDAYFRAEVFPLCTPLVLFPAVSVPFISNRSLNVVVQLDIGDGELHLARIKIPTVIPRAIRLTPKRNDFVLLEDVVMNNLESFFPGVKVVQAHLFRVVRDADVEIREIEAVDLISTIEETIRLRRFGDPVLLEVPKSMPDQLRLTLMRLLQLDEDDVLQIDGLIAFDVFWELAKIDKPGLRFDAHVPYLQEQMSTANGIFETVSQRDILLHHPYDSFRPVETLIDSASTDPNVFGIKQTLYRVGSESPIVESLMASAEAGKQVAAMVELKARFDESNNLVWARALERAGAHVTYGFTEMKTHAKLCLVVRREKEGLVSYAHIGTGNYNPVTSRLYTDLGLLTSDPEITQDISELFNYLTGISQQKSYRKLLVAPVNLREGILERIRREIGHAKTGKPGRIVWKLNSLVDPEVIEELYAASQAGVKVDLIIRGICCLRPGIKKLSENITVTSIVGRFLEHSRIYYFENGGKADALIGSADAMRRNLDRRVEVLVPVSNKKLVQHLRVHILETCLKDNVQAWQLGPSGQYTRRKAIKDKSVDSQKWFMANPTSKTQFSS